MKIIGMIGCWYKNDLYSHSCHDMMNALKSNSKLDIKFITSNCRCFSSSQTFGCTENELVDKNCDTIKLPYAPPNPSKKYGLFKYYVTKIFMLHFLFEITRGLLYFQKTKKSNLIHFDQVLNAFGFLSFITLLTLTKLNKKKIIVTINEIDPLQYRYKKLNNFYNKTDKVIAYSNIIKDELINLGVEKNKIEVIHYGVSLGSLQKIKRDQLIFYGGHRLLKGKGFDTLLNALTIIIRNIKTIKLLIYTGYGNMAVDTGKEIVKNMGLDQYVIWKEFLNSVELAKAYQKSICCIIPYTSGSGRHPITTAMANATPIIATRNVDIPEYLGELGLYFQENSAEQLAKIIINNIESNNGFHDLGAKLSKKAEEEFSWDIFARKLLRIYDEIGN